MQNDTVNLWENNIRKVVPYTPGEQPKGDNIIKLNTNENPYPPSPGVAKVLNNLLAKELKLYPDPTAYNLVKAIANYNHLNLDQVFVGVGSDDVLAMAFLSFFNSKKPILFPDITYSFYDVWANLFHIPYEQPELNENFRIVKEDYYKENGGIIIANPNAPTSIYEDLDFIRDILEHNQKSVIIIDEAYIDFGGQSAIELIKDYDNLLVVQTFSKSRSMAGMRIGYAMGSKKLIEALNQVKYSFNSYTLNLPSILCGVESIEDEKYFMESIKRIIDTREKTMVELKDLGFTFLKSKTNFIYAKHEKITGLKLYEMLRKNNIYVRHFNKPKINDYIRITIGTDEEMDVLLKHLREMIKEI